MFSVTSGPFAVTDANGVALCHGPRQTRQALNSSRRRMVKAAWMEALEAAGLANGAGVKCSDGTFRPRGEGVDGRDGFADFGHIVADANDGAFCACNAVPVEGAQNRANGDARQAVEGWTAEDHARYAQAFRAVALRTMTATKRQRAV